MRKCAMLVLRMLVLLVKYDTYLELRKMGEFPFKKDIIIRGQGRRASIVVSRIRKCPIIKFIFFFIGTKLKLIKFKIKEAIKYIT